ncbi:Bro-N domain-containing protein [Clostridium sp.]|uniref:BRO-N domain-containing protein n=1 Tax=Clostridium sp. TaxID=1506 RepID=UPI003521E2BB
MIYGTKENPLFLAKDVAEWIGHKGGVSQIMARIDEEEKVLHNVHTLGGSQEMWFLTEDGFYEILMQSRKPIAKAL